MKSTFSPLPTFKMPELDSTLTQAEKDAPTFLEWDDSTLARAVRCLAKRLSDTFGQNAIISIGGAIQLLHQLEKANQSSFQLTLNNLSLTVAPSKGESL